MKAGFRKNKPKPQVKAWDFDSEKKDLPTRRSNRLDPISHALSCAGFMFKMRWPWLVFEFGGVIHPLTVSRFYIERNLAVDIGPVDPNLREIKQQLCEKNGIKYMSIDSEYAYQEVIDEVHA